MMKYLLALAVLAAAPLAAAPAVKKAPVRAPLRVNWAQTIAATPEGGVRIGNPSAAIKLIEYGSRTCPHCARFDNEGLPVLKSGPIANGKLSYEFRDYPVHGALDLAPILLGRCVPVSRFFPVLDQMFANQQSLLAKVETVGAGLPANATPAQIATAFGTGLGYVAFMKKLGLPEARARACLNDKAAIDRIAARTKAGNDLYNIAGTPTFIVNGKPAENVYDWAGLEPVLRAAGA
jgi:protein-disulfide isomerase